MVCGRCRGSTRTASLPSGSVSLGLLRSGPRPACSDRIYQPSPRRPAPGRPGPLGTHATGRGRPGAPQRAPPVAERCVGRGRRVGARAASLPGRGAVARLRAPGEVVAVYRTDYACVPENTPGSGTHSRSPLGSATSTRLLSAGAGSQRELRPHADCRLEAARMPGLTARSVEACSRPGVLFEAWPCT